MRPLREWPIAARIGAGVGIPLLLAAGIGVKGAASIQALREATDRSAAAVELAVRSGQAHAGVLRLKVAVREYIARNSDARFRVAERVQAEAAAALLREEDRRVLDAYWRGFAAVAALRSEANGIRDAQLRANGTAMRQALEEAGEDWPGAAAAMRHLLLMRAYSDRFLETRLPEEAARVAREAASLGALLQAGGPAAALAPRLAEFGQGFARWQEIARRIEELDRGVVEAEGSRLIASLRDAERAAEADAAGSRAMARREAASALLLSLAGTLLALLLGLGAAFLVVRSVVRPLAATTRAMRALAQGRLDTAIPGGDRRDELGEMAKALGVFRDTMEARQRMEADAEAQRRAATRRQDEIDQLTGLFGRSIGGVFRRVAASCSAMQATAEGLAAGAGSTAAEASAIREASQGTLEGIQAVSAAAEELAVSVREIAGQAGRAAADARHCVEEAEGATAVAAALAEATTRIDEVVRVIAEVANRTNLLALNATIEAARAGEAGKGFAVVAAEVKALAGQTAQATGDIGRQIAAMRDAVERTVGTIRRIGGTIGTMNQGAVAVAEAVERQGAATAEIARVVEGLAAATQRVSASVVGLEGNAQATGSGAHDVSGRAGAVTTEAEAVAREVTEFLSALSGTKGGSRFRSCPVDLPAEVEAEGLRRSVRVLQINGGAVQVDTPLLAEPGDRFVLHVAGIDRPIAARFAGPAERGCHLQLPMDLDHVDWIEGEIRRLGLRQAA